MGYNYNTKNINIKKNNYDVYIREVTPFEYPTLTNELNVLLSNLSGYNQVELFDASTYADITQVNTVYFLGSTATGDINIDLSDAGFSLAGNVGDVLVFKIESSTHTLMVTDEDSEIVVLHGYVGDYLALTYGLDSKWKHSFYRTYKESDFEKYFTKIGACEEKPTIVVSAGQSITTNRGNTVNASENIEISINDLNISNENYTSLRAFEKIDVCFFCGKSPKATIFVRDILSNVFIEGVGNDSGKMTINSKIEVGNADDHIYLYNYE